MGRKGKETTLQERKIILKLHNQCKSLRQIADIVNRPKSTIQSIIDKHCETQCLMNKPRSGRPSLLSDQDKRYIVREVKKNPFTSVPKLTATLGSRGSTVSHSTVRRALRNSQYYGRVARKKPWVSKVNQKKRLEFARKHVNRDPEWWKRVIWTDESKFNLFGPDGRPMVWRQKNEETLVARLCSRNIR